MAVKVLLIGNGKFKNPKLNRNHSLDATVNDLKLMQFLLSWRFGVLEEDIITVGEQGSATKKEIRAGFVQLTKVVKPNDTVVIYYTGHGHRVVNPSRRADAELNLYGFVPFDVASANRPEELRAEDLFLAHELQSSLQALQNQKKPLTQFVILDCCFSGGFKAGPLPVSVVEEEDMGWKAELVNKSMAVEPVDSTVKFVASESATAPPYTLLAACKPDQRTQEMRIMYGKERFAISRFTRTLFRVVCDRPDVVDIYSLKSLLSQRLMALKQEQTPVLDLAQSAPRIGADHLFIVRPDLKWCDKQRRFPLSQGNHLAVGRLGGVGMGSKLALSNSEVLTISDPEQVGWFETRLKHPKVAELSTQGYLVAVNAPLN
jgi:hypothetical protein